VQSQELAQKDVEREVFILYPHDYDLWQAYDALDMPTRELNTASRHLWSVMLQTLHIHHP